MRHPLAASFFSGLLVGLPFILSGCADAPMRAPVAAKPIETAAVPRAPEAPPATVPAPKLAVPAVPAPSPADPEPPVSPGPPPDLAFSMAANDGGPPAAVNDQLLALVTRLKKGDGLSMRLTLFAPPVASREYALGLAAKASESLRRHLRELGAPTRKIIRVVIDPRRETISGDERIDVEVRLIGKR